MCHVSHICIRVFKLIYCMQGTVIILPLLATVTAKEMYGSTADEFIPDRWLQEDSVTLKDNANDDANAGNDNSATRKRNRSLVSNGKTSAKLPDHMAFLVGPRDCVGQDIGTAGATGGVGHVGGKVQV